MTAVLRSCVIVRDYRAADAPALARLFHDTVHAIAARDYTPDQLRAWSPAVPDAAA
jgi:putative acetyltransferase